MLPPFIIEQIRRREDAERRRQEADRPRLELPLDIYPPAPEESEEQPSEDRGVIILDISG